MKKLLVFAMVLAMASFASATLQISVGGAYDVTQVTLTPSQEIVLDIGTDTPITPGVGEGYFALVSSPLGRIDIQTGFTVQAYAADGGIAIEHSAYASEYVMGLAPGQDGLAGGVLLSLVSSVAPGTIFDGIIFHCEGMGDAVISLLALTPNFEVIGPVDTVVVHQIPEPVTIALLGLGGLFLRRRIA
jgi:hypothetical protein